MKRIDVLHLFSTLAVMLLFSQMNINAQVTVVLRQPPPYQFKVEHLWKVTLINHTKTTYRVTLLGTVIEAMDGLIVESRTAAFTLPPGTKVVGPRDLTPLDIKESNPKYADVVKNIGGVPTGDYEICLTVINADNGLELGRQCVPAQVQNLTQVELLGPDMGATFSLHGGLDEVWNQPAMIAPVAINKGLRFMISKGSDGSSTAYRMGDPVPGVDINLEQIPGGIKIPVKEWDDYIREVGIKEEGIKFAELRVVTDTDGSTVAYLMGDPVPGVDINLEQIPDKKIPLKGIDEYIRDVGIKEEGVMRLRGIEKEQIKRTQGVDVGIKEEGIKRVQGVDVGIKEEKVRILFTVGKNGNNKAYRMGDPVPGVDINLEQIPGGKGIPVMGWDEYIRDVGIKEEEVKFTEIRVVNDTLGSKAAYFTSDAVPGVDITLIQVSVGKEIELMGEAEFRSVFGTGWGFPPTYARLIDNRGGAAARSVSAVGSIPIVGGAIARSGDVIPTQRPQRTMIGSQLIFNWLAPTPIPPGARVTYRLRIAEAYGNQSPYDAMRSNPAFFENRNITSPIYQYPTGARPFRAGMRYAWKVDVYINNVLISESETWEFGMAAEEQRRKSGSIIVLDRAQMSDQHQEPVKNRPILLASLGLGPELLLLQDRTPAQESSDRSPLQFSGNVRFNTTLASRVASFSEQPRNQWTAALNPVLTFYGLPFTASFLLSSQQEANRQSINNFGFNFDVESFKEQIRSRLENKITEEATGGEKLFMSVNALGIGTNYPSYSDYTLNGVPVTGINVEVNPGIFYAAFTASTNQRGIDNSSYSRSLYAGRIGLGKKEGTHLYFTGLYAKDDEGSIRLDPANNTLTPKANYVFGTEAKLNLFGDILSLQGEGALAVLTRDTRDPELEHKSMPDWVKNLVDPRISTSFDYSYSGKLAFNNDASATMVSLGIKMVGPGYTSLGVPNLRTDQFGYEAKLDQRFFERKVSVGTFYKRYNDNLIKWKRSTTTTTAYGINLGFTFPRIPFLRLSYSPYSQKNDDLNPLRKVDNTTSVYSVMTGYSYQLGNLNSSTSFTFSGQETKTVSGISDYRTNSFMVTEAVSLNIPLSFTASWGLIQTTYGLGVSAPSAGGPIQTISALSDSRINNIDLGANAQVTDGLSIMGGVNLATEQGRNRRTGFYVSSNVSPFQWLGIDVRAERNVYTEQQAALGEYREFIFSATLTAQW